MGSLKRLIKVVVAMSGGVDSSLAAALLVEQGYDVIGVYMKNWSAPIKGVEHCPWVADQLDARMVAEGLGIPFYTVDFEEQYKRLVVESFLADYASGRTPNPDVLCNKFIKFDAFFQYARNLGADLIATGHYARITAGQIYQPKDKHKDQTYFLWAIAKKVLPYCLFPLGNLTKAEVRQAAAKRGLATANKRDSQGICFIGQADVRAFISEHLEPRQGEVIDPNGQVIGRHNGAWLYTIGQRAGIANLSWGDPANRPPLYVLATDVKANTITVGKNDALFGSGLEANSLSWLAEAPKVGQRLMGRIRHGQTPFDCDILKIDSEHLELGFLEPERAVTPGQSVVLYDDGKLIGGGIITRAVK